MELGSRGEEARREAPVIMNPVRLPRFFVSSNLVRTRLNLRKI